MPYHSKKSKRLHGTSPLESLKSVSGKSPAKDNGKSTVQMEMPREVQAIENVYEFFTKQRPLAWQYYYRQITVPFFRTGTSFEDNKTFSALLDTLDVNEALVLNHLSASIFYRPYEAPVVGTIKPGNYVALERPEMPIVNEFFLIGQFRAIFNFNLVSSTSRLYEANVQSNTGNYPYPVSVTTSNLDGYTTLNSNVLENGESVTSLYVMDTGDLSVEFDAIDTYTSTPANPFAFGFLPENLDENNGGIIVAPKIVFTVRGHKLNRNDAELLKTLIQNN